MSNKNRIDNLLMDISLLKDKYLKISKEIDQLKNKNDEELKRRISNLEFKVQWGITKSDLIKKLIGTDDEAMSLRTSFWEIKDVFYIDNERHVKLQKFYYNTSWGLEKPLESWEAKKTLIHEVIKHWPENKQNNEEK